MVLRLAVHSQIRTRPRLLSLRLLLVLALSIHTVLETSHLDLASTILGTTVAVHLQLMHKTLRGFQVF